MKIVGIDLSLTSTGVAVISDELPECYITQTITPRLSGTNRLIEIRDKLLLGWCGYTDLVVLEGYAFAKNNRAHQMGELGGVIRVALTEQRINWIEVPPARVKKFCTGKGNAPKDIMIQQVYKHWGVECKTSDEADAFVLAKIGWALKVDREGLTKYQLEVVEELEKKGELS